MTANPNIPPKPYDSSLWAFGVLTFFCCLGVAGIAFLYQKDQKEQARTDLRHIPPERIGYRQTAVFATPVSGKPTSFALLNDSAFVVGSADPPMLSLFDETGTLLRTIALPEEPRAIVCGTPNTIFTGKIVVAHPKRIAVYTTSGDQVLLLGLPNHMPNHRLPDEVIVDTKYNVRSLVLTPEYLFAADSEWNEICRFDVEGNNNFGGKRADGQVRGWGTLSHVGVAFDGFVVYAAPITMTFSPKSGLLYIANPGRHRVEVFTQDGIYQPELSWGEPSGKLEGFAACCNPIGLAVLDDGRILTVEKGIARIKIYRTDGTLDTVVAGPDVLDNPPPEIARTPIEPGGRYFSAVPLKDDRIAVFDFEGFIRIFAPLDAVPMP